MVVHGFNCNTCRHRHVDLCDFKAGIKYIINYLESNSETRLKKNEEMNYWPEIVYMVKAVSSQMVSVINLRLAD